MREPRRNGFTLAEILTVLVIIAIVLSIAIPAVTNLTKASALNYAAREVSNAMSLARQYAITQRTTTRVVFPYDGTGALNHPDMWYHTYAVMANPTPTVPTGWKYVTKWEYLPAGVVFLRDPLPTAPSVVGALNNPNSLAYQVNLPFPDTAVPTDLGTLSYIEFAPTGAATPLAVAISQAGTLTMQEGFIDNNGLPQATPINPPNYRIFVVDAIVGRIQTITP